MRFFDTECILTLLIFLAAGTSAKAGDSSDTPESAAVETFAQETAEETVEDPVTELPFDVIKLPSVSAYKPRETPLQTIIMHCMGTSLEESVEILTQWTNASAHYFIPQISGAEFLEIFSEKFSDEEEPQVLKYPDRPPVIEIVTPETSVAYHAGLSSWGASGGMPLCEKGLNHVALGIELHAPGYANGDGSDWHVYTPYTPTQIDVTVALIQYLQKKFHLSKNAILGHSDISPGRKTDPGPLFPWKSLWKEFGLGLPIPGAVTAETTDDVDNLTTAFKEELKAIGYTVSLGDEWTEHDQACWYSFNCHFMADRDPLLSKDIHPWKDSRATEYLSFIRNVRQACDALVDKRGLFRA